MIKKANLLMKEYSYLMAHWLVSVAIVLIMIILMGAVSPSHQVSKKPISRELKVPPQIVTILDVNEVGKVEADLTSNELIFTSYQPGRGGTYVRLFDEGTLVRETGVYVYRPKRVTMSKGHFYMATIIHDDKIGIAYFRISPEGNLAKKVVE